jgi:hypothetical protein
MNGSFSGWNVSHPFLFDRSFDFSPEEVVEFCQDCVLALDSEEPCDIPEAFFGQTEGFSP